MLDENVRKNNHNYFRENIIDLKSEKNSIFPLWQLFEHIEKIQSKKFSTKWTQLVFFNMAHPRQSFSSESIPDINKRFFAMCSQVNLWLLKLPIA